MTKTKTKIVYEMDGIDYEFVGNQISFYGADVLFRSKFQDRR